MKETSKCRKMRKARGDFDRYLRGHGIDIGPGNDPLRIRKGKVTPYDLMQGDGAYVPQFADGTFDFVYSSHCLEHLSSVEEALRNWTRILKPGGYLYFVVPDFDLYEKRQWPSRFNPDHKSTFSLNLDRQDVGRETHFGLQQMCAIFRSLGAILLRAGLEDEGFDYSQPATIDQTLGRALSQICFVLQKPKETAGDRS